MDYGKVKTDFFESFTNTGSGFQSTCGCVCCAGCIFFDALYDSDHPASSDAGAVYSSDKSRRYDSGYKGVSLVRRLDDHIDRQSGV